MDILHEDFMTSGPTHEWYWCEHVLLCCCSFEMYADEMI